MPIKIEMIAQYWAFIIFTSTAFILCIIMLIGGWLLGGRSNSRYKNTPFESGIESVGDTHIRFSAKFYLIAMFFVIFDVESLFLYAWSVSIKECGWSGFIEATIFIMLLLSSLVYLVRIGAMDWTPKKRPININKTLLSNFSSDKIINKKGNLI